MKKKSKLISALVVLAFFIGVFVFPVVSSAQMASLAITPVKIELEDVLGNQVSEKIKVFNKSSEEIDIYSYIQDYDVDSKYQYEFFEPGHLPTSSASWISVFPDEFTLRADNSQEVSVKADIPSDTFSGTHHAVIFFQTKNSLDQSQEGAKVGNFLRIGVPVLIVAKDGKVQLKREGDIASFDVETKFKPFIEGLSFKNLLHPSKIKVSFKNLFRPQVIQRTVFEATGNTHVNVGGRSKFESSWFGAPYEGEQSSVSVLPNSKREFAYEWKDAPTIGPATASTTLIYPLGQEEWGDKTVTKSFWIIPWQLLTLLFIVIGIIVAVWGIIWKSAHHAVKNGRKRIDRL